MIKTKIEAMKHFITLNPKVHGNNKHLAISLYLKMYGTHSISADVVREITTLDRAWRKVLADNPSLDHRGDTAPQEDHMKSELGYNV